ncbi:MAG: hypothetical protein KAH09_11225, partial [Desulfobacula sp.]|nr:hypothetical protein [Desulfobacula sp.]
MNKSIENKISLEDNLEPEKVDEPRLRFRVTFITIVCISILAVWILIAFIGPSIAPYDQGEMITYDSFTPIGE